MLNITLGTGIAFAAIIFSAAQLWIAFIRLRMDLLKPRLEVYEAFGNFLGLAMTHGTNRGDPEIKAAYDLFPKIGFLFGDEVRQLCEEILDAETRRRLSQSALQTNAGDRVEHVQMNQAALATLIKCRETLEGTFKPYLNVSTIALPFSSRLQAWFNRTFKKIKKARHPEGRRAE